MPRINIKYNCQNPPGVVLDPKFKAKEWLRKTIRSTAARFILVVIVC